MKNGDRPAYVVRGASGVPYSTEGLDEQWLSNSQLTLGLTKREIFCIHAGIPETGDSDLDEIIQKSERKKFAMAAMQGMLADPSLDGAGQKAYDIISHDAIKHADSLLRQLENDL